MTTKQFILVISLILICVFSLIGLTGCQSIALKTRGYTYGDVYQSFINDGDTPSAAHEKAQNHCLNNPCHWG